MSATVERQLEAPVQPAATRPSLWTFVQSSGLQSVVVGPSKDPNAKVTILLVSAESGEPLLAVKAPTTDLAATAVERERQVLAQLHERVTEAIGATIPRPVEGVDYDGRPAVVMTAVAGTPMTMSYVRRRHRRSATRVAADFAAIDSWLGALRRDTAAEPEALELDAGVTERLQRRFAGEPLLEAALDSLAEIHARLRVEAVPRTAVHGDLWFGNILVTGGRVTGVVDWEAGAATGVPARDLARFALMYALYLGGPAEPRRRVTGHRAIERGTWGAAVEYALGGNGWFPELFRDFLGGGLAALGASPTLWRDLALAGIAETAAFTDHGEFARHHLDLFSRCAHSNRGRKEKR